MKNTINKWLVVVFVGAFILRLISIEQSLWLDEGTTARVIQEYSYFEILSKFSLYDFHPPLYYFFMKFWSTLFGVSEFSLRLPSVIFSLITGYLVYRLGTILKDAETGFWAAFLYLFNPLVIYYSQEARMYSMVVLFLTAATVYLLRITDSKKLETNHIVWFNIFVFLSFISFYGSVFGIASMYCYLLIKKRYKTLLLSLPGFVIVLIIVSPLLYYQFVNSRRVLGMIHNWSLVLGKANLKNTLLIPIKFSIGRIQFLPKMLYYVIASIWSLLVFIPVVIASYKQKQIALLFWLPLGIGFVFSFFVPLLQYFRFLYLVPILSVLLITGISGINFRKMVAAGFIVFSLVYLVTPGYHRENWKLISSFLPHSTTVYIIPESSDALTYYRDDLKIRDIRVLGKTQLTAHTLYVIPYITDLYGVEYRSTLDAQTYRLEQTVTERGVTLEEWKRGKKVYATR